MNLEKTNTILVVVDEYTKSNITSVHCANRDAKWFFSLLFFFHNLYKACCKVEIRASPILVGDVAATYLVSVLFSLAAKLYIWGGFWGVAKPFLRNSGLGLWDPLECIPIMGLEFGTLSFTYDQGMYRKWGSSYEFNPWFKIVKVRQFLSVTWTI